MTKRLRRRRNPEGKPVRPLGREAFPTLTAFLRGYLHEDFPEVHGSVRSAATAFSQDASPEERRQLAQELESLLRAVADHPARELRRFVTAELGSRWEPISREELAELLELFRRPS
jgi:CdiI immunity protein